jgi:hypothetical protein
MAPPPTADRGSIRELDIPKNPICDDVTHELGVTSFLVCRFDEQTQRRLSWLF